MTTQVGDYQIQDELGRGGMGVVHRALGPEGPCALKVLSRGRDAARFAQEIELVRRLDHPAIVRLLDAGVTPDGHPYMALELVDGEPLSARLAQGPLPPPLATRLAGELAAALAHAHERGVIHRDLKPGNVLITRDGQLKLLDFGIGKRLSQLEQLTQTGELLGTPAYMAPEQARSDKRAIGPATDVYAFGATLYAMLTGAPPFRARNTMALLHALLNLTPKPPSALQPGIDPRLDAICLRCLAKRPDERYPHARALAEALRELEAPSPVPAPARWLRRTLVLALLAALGSGIWRVQQGRARPPTTAAIAPPESAAQTAQTSSTASSAPTGQLWDQYDAIQLRIDSGEAAAQDDLALLLALVRAQNPPTAAGLLVLADDALRDLDVGRASLNQVVELCQRARELDPSRGEPDLIEGRALLTAPADLERALHCLRRAQELDPDLLDAKLSEPVALQALGRHDEALAIGTRLVADHPDIAASWAVQARLLAAVNRRPEALKCAEIAHELAPTRLQLRLLLANLYALEQRPRQVGALLHDQRSTDVRIASRVLSVLGLLAMQEGLLDEAERLLREALDFDARSAQALGVLARVRVQRIYLEGPIPPPPSTLLELDDLTARALAIDVGARHAVLARVEIAVLVGDAANAERLARELVAGDPTWLPARACLGQALVATGQCERAIEILEPVTEAWQPWPPRPRLALASALVRCGRLDEAAAQVEAIDAQGDFALAHLARAHIALLRGDFAEAVAATERSLAEIETAVTWVIRARALMQLGRAAEALEAVDRAEAISNHDPLIRTLRAQLEPQRNPR